MDKGEKSVFVVSFFIKKREKKRDERIRNSHRRLLRAFAGRLLTRVGYKCLLNQVLISGATDGNIDLSDMRANTRYAGGFTSLDRNVHRF